MEDQFHPKANGMGMRLRHLREKCEEKLKKDLVSIHGIEVLSC